MVFVGTMGEGDVVLWVKNITFFLVKNMGDCCWEGVFCGVDIVVGMIVYE
jgi:hypothetical protein